MELLESRSLLSLGLAPTASLLSSSLPAIRLPSSALPGIEEGPSVTIPGSSNPHLMAFVGVEFHGLVAILPKGDGQGVEAVIDWGDGNRTAGLVFNLDDGYAISGSNTYPQEGTFVLAIAVDDPNDPSTEPTILMATIEVITQQLPPTQGTDGSPPQQGPQVTVLGPEAQQPIGGFSSSIPWVRLPDYGADRIPVPPPQPSPDLGRSRPANFLTADQLQRLASLASVPSQSTPASTASAAPLPRTELSASVGLSPSTTGPGSASSLVATFSPAVSSTGSSSSATTSLRGPDPLTILRTDEPVAWLPPRESVGSQVPMTRVEPASFNTDSSVSEFLADLGRALAETPADLPDADAVTARALLAGDRSATLLDRERAPAQATMASWHSLATIDRVFGGLALVVGSQLVVRFRAARRAAESADDPRAIYLRRQA